MQKKFFGGVAYQKSLLIFASSKSHKMTTKKSPIGSQSKIESKVLDFYAPKSNEQVVCIENFDGYSYKVYAVYVDGEYDRRIKIRKF